jgi:alcohol dehydrogenase class IV
LAAAAMADACARGNPREATLDDVVALYIAAF